MSELQHAGISVPASDFWCGSESLFLPKFGKSVIAILKVLNTFKIQAVLHPPPLLPRLRRCPALGKSSQHF